MTEVWRIIPEHPNYEVSSFGRIRRGSYIKSLIPDKDGYFRVSLTTLGEEKLYRVNRIVCTVFQGDPPTPNSLALHKDNNNQNNNESNLYWGTSQDNSNDRSRASRHSTKLDWNKVREIRARVSSGEKPFAIMGEYGISSTTIHNIVHNNSWKEIGNVR